MQLQVNDYSDTTLNYTKCSYLSFTKAKQINKLHLRSAFAKRMADGNQGSFQWLMEVLKYRKQKSCHGCHEHMSAGVHWTLFLNSSVNNMSN